MASGPARREPLKTPLWKVTLWALMALALLLGLAAGSAIPSVRRASVLLLVLCALGIAAVVSNRWVPEPEEGIVGGPGYTAPQSRRVYVLHLLITVLYNVGIGIVVFALLVRLRALGFTFPSGAERIFPLAMAAYLLLLALAAQWRIAERGGVRRTWYTRAHG